MAIATNTITRYDGYRAVREDLANVIYNISPVDVPFMSNVGRENVKNTYFEWQTDNLAAASGSNAQLEGNDYNGTATARTPTQPRPNIPFASSPAAPLRTPSIPAPSWDMDVPDALPHDEPHDEPHEGAETK